MNKVIDSEKSEGVVVLDETGKDQLEIMKVQQELEKERIMRTLDMDIDQHMEGHRNDLEEEHLQKLQAERDGFNKRISGAKNENDKKRLMQELRDREKKMEAEMENEKLRQDRTLEERKQNRLNKKRIKEMELDSKNMNEL